MNDNVHPEPVEVSAVPVLQSLSKGEMETKMELARRFPRNVKQFQDDLLSLVSLNEETAESCFYAVPRGGKSIEGASARLAELALNAWGNCVGGARVISEDERFVTAQGVFHDLQRNVSVSYEVRRRITDKQGRRYNDDMITVTANAACSIALRNAVFKGIPKALWQDAYGEARKIAIGDVRTLETRRAQMLEHFGKMGVPEERIAGAVGRISTKDITLEDLVTLKGIANSIKEGELSVDNAFPDPAKDAKAATEKLKDLAENGAPRQRKTRSDKGKARKPAPEPEPEAESPDDQIPMGDTDTLSAQEAENNMRLDLVTEIADYLQAQTRISPFHVDEFLKKHAATRANWRESRTEVLVEMAKETRE